MTVLITKTIEMDGERNDLPEGWLRAALPSVCTLNPPKPHLKALPPDLPVAFIPMPAVDETLGAIVHPQTRRLAEVRKGYTAFQDEDVIMAKITPCMENGKAAVARNLKNGLGFGSTEFHVLRSNGAVLPEYVYHYIRQESYRRDAESEMTGSVGQKRVPVRFLEQTLLPVPPLLEQKRIIRAIADLLAPINLTRGHLTRIPKILKAFRQSVLAAACSGRLTEEWRESNPVAESAGILIERIARNTRGSKHSNSRKPDVRCEELPELPAHWAWATMGQIADVQGGIQQQPKRTPKDNAFPYLRVANVLRDRLDLSEIREMELFRGELETYRLIKDDLLIVEGNGSLTEVGRSALWTDEIEDCVHQNHIIRVRARECLPAYLNIYWNSPAGMGRIMNSAVTTAGLYSLSTKKVSGLPVAIAPIEEQHEIVRRVEALFKFANKIDERVTAAAKQSDRLTQAILAKAFRGELVVSEAELSRREGRSYETAGTLLSRIRANRRSQESFHGEAAPRFPDHGGIVE